MRCSRCLEYDAVHSRSSQRSCVMVLTSAPAFAQEADSDPNPGSADDHRRRRLPEPVHVPRHPPELDGIRDLACDRPRHLAAYSGDGGLKSVGINFGTWNSLHTGDTGLRDWPERQAVVRVGLLRARSDLASAAARRSRTTYTAYTSPNNRFTTVKEIMFKLARRRQRQAGQGSGQAVHRDRAGVRHRRRPRSGRRRRQRGHLSGDRHCSGLRGAQGEHRVPDQGRYERRATTTSSAGEDNKFGYFSIAGIVTVPLGGHDELRVLEHSRRRRVPDARHTHEVLQRRRRATRSSVRSESGSLTSTDAGPSSSTEARACSARSTRRSSDAAMNSRHAGWYACCWVPCASAWRIAGVGPGFGSSRSEPGNLTLTGGIDFAERVSLPRHSTGRHRRRHVAVRRSWDRAAFRRRRLQEHRRQHRLVEQSPHRRRGKRRSRAGSCGTSRTSTRRSSLGFGKGTRPRRDLHGVHESERMFKTVKELVVQGGGR